MSTLALAIDQNWKEKFKSLIATPEEAVAKIKPGHRVFIGTGCAEPRILVDAMCARSGELTDVEITHLLTFGKAPYANEKMRSAFRVNTFFISENVRDIVQKGLGDYTPILLSDIPRLFHSGQVPIDVALIQVSPPDEEGRCSLGVSVDIVKSAAENASLVIAQVNPQMPRVLGNTFLHAYDMDVLVPLDEPIPELPPLQVTETTKQIAEYVAALVEDGSTLELGIGRIPHALLGFLKNKKDLGIHTEMITDDMIELIKSGAINGKRKTLDRGKVVASFALGTKKLYDFINNNPVVAFHPTEYVNDTTLISRQHKMVAVNTALEVDLTGQVCADSIGDKFFSGIGGQVDFNRGAARSRGGKAIIALPSTAKGGKISRIVCRSSPGAGVVTTRGDVHYVITEHGVAYLHGKSIQERALALISLAHPKFQPQLIQDAIKAKFISVDMAEKRNQIVVGPKELQTTHLLQDGTPVSFRAVHPTDESRMRHLFYALSKQTIYYRFMRAMKEIPRKQIQDFVFVDHRNEVAIVGTVKEAHGEDIIAVGRYILDPKTNRAEVAFTVQDNWQNKGIGTFLLQYLIRIGRRNGIHGFTAEVLADNRPMQHVFQKGNYKTRYRLKDNIYSFEIDF
jgi:acyl-CoA hydrolase/GNAT superfamily N-acetyltransferase